MPSVNTLMAMGFQAEQAKAVAAGVVNASQASAGSTIADAEALVGDTVLCAAGSGEGVQLRDEEGSFFIACSGNDLKVYPHSASGKINNGSAGAAYSIDAGDGAIFVRVDALNWACAGMSA